MLWTAESSQSTHLIERRSRQGEHLSVAPVFQLGHQQRTFARPLMRLMQNVSSSLLSSSARTQCFGGCRYRPHPLHHSMVTCGSGHSILQGKN